jgi:glycosyltransferase involved in cell wall biosynthesis
MTEPNVSILILTKTEEKDLPGCLHSISWSDDIVVYDSFSTDSTGIIAESAGARFIQRKFDNWSSHQNWGLSNISFKNKWVLYLDADERLGGSSHQELLAIASSSDPSCVAYRLRRRDFLDGRHLKHVQISPWYIRLFVPRYIHYDRLVNPVTIVDGPVGTLSNSYLDHFPFSKGYSHWIERHNSYSTYEARQIITNSLTTRSSPVGAGLFASDVNIRRSSQKELFYSLPFRPLLKFFILYFLKRGFLDGAAGFKYAILQSIYEYFIVLKVDELKDN